MARHQVHALKTWIHYFQRIWDGDKTFEVRYDDRGYQKGDRVVLREWDRDLDCLCVGHDHARTCERYTGREIHARIGHVMSSTPARGNQRGFQGQGYVVFSLCDTERIDHREPRPPVAPPIVTPADVAAARRVCDPS